MAFDQWILNKFESFSCWWHKIFGQDCFWFAKQSALFFSLSLLVYFAGVLLYEPKHLDVSTSLLIELVPGILLYRWVNRLEKTVQDLQMRSLANHLKFDLAPVRILCSLVIPPFILKMFFLISTATPNVPLFFKVLGASFLFWLVITLYFGSCDLPPATKSKARKWLESFAASLGNVFMPRPQPVPIRIPSR